MATGLEGAAARSGENHRKLIVIMFIAIANGAAVDEHGVFEDGFSVGVFHGIECADEARETIHVPAFDFGDLLDFFLVAGVVCKEVMAFGDAEVWEGAVAAF